MNQEGSVLHVTSNLKISSRIDDKYLLDEHSLDEHFEVNGKILNESNFLCINCGPQVSILRKKNGSKYSFWSANRTTRDSISKITCIVEVNLGTGVPLLAAGTEEGLLCFYYTGVSRILRAVQFSHKIVSLALLDNGDRSEIGNWISLPEELQMMNGVLAVGLDGGAVYLVDICRHLLEKSILEGGPVTIEIPSQLLLINLRTDTANDIEAKKEYAHSHPGETLAIFLNESTLDQFRNMITSKISSPVQRRSIDNSIEEFHLVVTALAYFKEIACLAVGFNSGCFQLWHVSLFRIIYVSPLMNGQMMPIAGFSFQEPTDDPHSVCFIWAAHQSSSTNATRPFAAMYMVSFGSKKHVDGYGCFYENYKGCQPKYELALGEDVDSVIDGRIISCHSISKVIQRRLPQWSTQSCNEDETIVSVCAIAWEVWTPDRTNVTSKLTLFDINQWYRAQMPFNLDSGCSNSYITNLMLPNSNEEQPEPLLDVWISAESLSQFSTYQPLDEHYFPLSLSFACTCLYEHKKLECVWKGVQNELLSGLDSAGPSALLDPSRYFNRFLAVGLKPSFYEAADSANLSVVTERQMLLTVMLEQGHISFVKECVRMWADGCLAVANCTLPTLLRWGWSAVTFYKQMADNICIQLFDLRSTPTMKEFIYVVSLLHKLSEIFDYILKNYRNFILEDNVELQSISLQLFIEYLDSVVWSTQHKLLPEVNEPSANLPDVIQYPQATLQNNIIERREKMRQLSRKLLDVNPQLCLTDLMLVDTLLKTTPGGKRIISQWEAEGSVVGGLYPPPSVQSILRIFLVRGVATDFKHVLIYYFLLDVADLLQQDHPSASKMLQNFVTKFRLTKSQVLITKAFWLIDHGKLKEAVDHLTHNNVSQNDITESNHKTVMYSLFVQGEPKLALVYSRAFNPLLSELEDAKFHILILLECGHILQAFDFQRKYKQWQTELLDLFFTVCMRRKELGIVYKLSLDSSEEEAFTQFLEANRHPHSEDLRVLYLLSRARYVEAIDVNKKLAVKRAQGAAPAPVFERRTPLKGVAFKKNTQKPKDDESRDQIRDVIVSAFAKTLPPITRELADFCSRQKVTLGSWKKVDRPDPLSVAVNQQPLQAGLKERFVELALAKTRQTWAPLLATPHALKSRMRSSVEDTPFLRSTPFSFKSKANSPRELNHSLMMSASKCSVKRGLGSDEVDDASLLKSESRTKRARLEFDDALDKKKDKEDGALLFSTPFIKRKRAAVPSEVTPRTPLSILKSPWKSGQSSLSRHSERSDAPSSPMPRQIRFCEELETESIIEKRNTPSRAISCDAKSAASAKESIQEMSETDEDIDMTSPSPLTLSDSENCDTEQSFIKVTFSLDKENSQNRTQLDSDSAKTSDAVVVHDFEIDNEQPQSSSPPEEDSSVIDIPSSDSRVDTSSPDRIAASCLSTYEDKERYTDDYEEQMEEPKTYQDLSKASVFVNVTGELESSVFEELEDGEIGTQECDAVELGEDAVISKEVVYNDEVVQEKEEEPDEIDDTDENKIDIYAGIDDDDEVEKEDNSEAGDDDLYNQDEYMENYRHTEVDEKTEKNEFSKVEEHNREEEEEDSEKGEERGRTKQDEEEEDDDDDDSEVICLDDSSNSDYTTKEEPVTVIQKRNRVSSEEELDYNEEEGEPNNFDDEMEENEEEEFIEEEEENFYDEDEEAVSEEEEVEGEEEEDEEEEEEDEEYARKLSDEGTSNDSSETNSNKEAFYNRFINPFCKKKEVASTPVQDVSEIKKVTSNEEEKTQDKVEVDDDCRENQECVEGVEKLSEDTKCETNAEDVDADDFELKIDDVTGNASAIQPDQSAHESEHNESFGKLEISYEEEPGSVRHSISNEQVDDLMTVDENVSEVVESKLDTIEEESVENRTEASTELASETKEIPKAGEQSDTAVKNEQLETHVNSDEHVSEKLQLEDISDEHVSEKSQLEDISDENVSEKSQRKDISDEHVSEKSQLKDISDEHVSEKLQLEKSQRKDISDEHEYEKSQLKDISDEHVSEKSQFKDISDEHASEKLQLEKSQRKDISDEHVSEKSQLKNISDEHVSEKLQFKDISDEQVSEKLQLEKSQRKDISDEHVSEKSQLKNISDEHVSEKLQPKDAQGEDIYEKSQFKDVSDDHTHEATVHDSSLSTPLRTRQNRRSSSEVPPSRDLRLRRSMRKSSSSNHLTDLPSTTVEEKNVSKDFFDNSPTVPLNIQNTRSRRSSSVAHTPSKVTRQSLRKSTSTSLLPDVTKIQAEETTVVSSSHAMEETLKTSKLNSLKDSDSSTIIEDKSEVTLKNSSEQSVVESMVIDETAIFDKTNNVQQTIEQENTDLGFISDNKTTTNEVEVDETLKKKTDGTVLVAETIVEESGSVVEPSVTEKRSSLEATSKVEERAAADELATATSVSDSFSCIKDIKRPGSIGTASEAPESVFNENEDPIIPRPLQRRAASVSKLDDATGKLDRIRRSSRRYRSGMVWSEYSKNVDSYKKLPLNRAASVSSALDTADDVSLASVRESISSATTATSSRKLRHSRFKDRSSLRTAFRSFDVLLSDEEDDTSKSAVVSHKRLTTRSSSVTSIAGSITTVAEEISPIKSIENNDESRKEIETHSESMITTHEEQQEDEDMVEKDVEPDEDVVNETKNDNKIDSVIPKKTRKAKTETKSTKRKLSTQSKDDSDDDICLTDLKNKVLNDKKGTRKSVADDSKVEVSKPMKRSRSISSLSSTSKQTQLSHNDETEEESSGRVRLRIGRVSRSESPVGVRKLPKRSSTVDGDLFGNDSPDTSLTTSLRKTIRRDLRRSKLLDRPPSRNVLDVILSENEEEEEDEEKEEDTVLEKMDDEEGDDKKKAAKTVKKRGKKELSNKKERDIEEEESETLPPTKGRRGRPKTAVVSDVESTPATPKRTRKTKQVAEDSDVSVSAASSSKQPKRGRRSSVVLELDNSPAKSTSSRLFSSPESVASNASTSKKRKRLSHLMPASSTPETNAHSDVSVIDSSVIDYSSSRRLTRHQLANMQKFPMLAETSYAEHSNAENSSVIDFSSRRSTRHQPAKKFPTRQDESILDESDSADSDNDGSLAESSVSSVMSTRSSARLRMKSMKK